MKLSLEWSRNLPLKNAGAEDLGINGKGFRCLILFWYARSN